MIFGDVNRSSGVATDVPVELGGRKLKYHLVKYRKGQAILIKVTQELKQDPRERSLDGKR